MTLSIDIGAHYRPGDTVTVDYGDDGDYVDVTVDAEGERRHTALTPRQALAFAAALVHIAREIERRG